jgi:hypothetical protein
MGLSNSLLPSGFPTRNLYVFLSHTCHMPPTHPILLNSITLIIFSEEYNLQMLSSFSPASCYFLLLWSKHLPHHSQPMFFS